MFLTMFLALISWFGNGEETSVLRGETYVMNVPKGWEASTGEKMAGKPFRRKIAGYEVLTTTRIHPEKATDCSIEISEYLKCSDCSSIRRKDSLMLLSSGLIADMSWHMENDVTPGNYVDLIGKPHRHLETGKEMVVRERVWYKAGKDNVYVIKFGTTSVQTWTHWLPKMEKLVATLREF